MSTRQVEGAIFGFLLKNDTGQDLFGTNTKQQKIKIKSLKKDQNVKISWKFPNILNQGKYYVTLAVSDRDGVTQFDWWNDAIVLSISKVERVSSYPINPKIIIAVE